MKKLHENLLKASLFHEHWWLEAVTGGRFSEVEVRHGDDLVGRLPFVIARRKGFRFMGMPHFTHLLGPVVNSGDGKPQTRMMKRLAIAGALIDQLPRFDFYKQTVDPVEDDELAAMDGLAFQSRGFQVAYQCTFRIDCRDDLKTLHAGMESRVRQNIRRGEERFAIETIDDSERFVGFYEENLKKSKRENYMSFDGFPALFSECRARNCGVILAAMRPDGLPTAMTFLVWDNRTMYYLLTTRAPDVRENGSVSMMIWSAMTRAHELGLMLDLDGVTTEGTARFLSGFGGDIRTRFVITKTQSAYNIVQSAKTILRGGRLVKPTYD